MNRQSLIIAALALSLVMLSIALFSLPARAAENAGQPSHVLVFTYASGLTGFLDQNTGKIYVYDANLKNCVLTRKMRDLGQPMEQIKNMAGNLSEQLK
ncbi:hypothetical protein GX586_13835 [bacterium]|nr:hypothetical protein [bacterium]